MLASALGLRPLVAHCHLGRGKLALRRGQTEAARQRLASAGAMYRQMDMRSWLEIAERG